MNKRGIMWRELGLWLLALAALVVIIFIIFLLKDKLFNLFEKFMESWRR